jgi:hypothetical protein
MSRCGRPGRCPEGLDVAMVGENGMAEREALLVCVWVCECACVAESFDEFFRRWRLLFRGGNEEQLISNRSSGSGLTPGYVFPRQDPSPGRQLDSYTRISLIESARITPNLVIE